MAYQEDQDPNAHVMIRVELTNGEACAIYAAAMTIQDIGTRGRDPRLDAAIEKFKQAQAAAIVESIKAEKATGTPQ